jgi:hypothetical protein
VVKKVTPQETVIQETVIARDDQNNNNSDPHAPTSNVVVAFSSSIQEKVQEIRSHQTDTEPTLVSHISSAPEAPIPLDPPSPETANQAAEQALLAVGIGPKVAQRLASRYRAERIAEKLDYLAFLQEERPDTVQNPRGWLRRALEEDYGPPDGFITKEERARREVEAVEAAQRAAAIEQSHQAFAAQVQEQQEERRRRLQEQYGTMAADYQLWEEVLTLFKYGQPDLHYLYARAHILRCTEEVVVLGFEQEGLRRKLEHPGILKALQRQLQLIAK